MPIHGYLGGVISATAPSVTTAGASGIFTLEEQLQASAQNNWPGYQISRSVRLRSSASAYFSRTPSSASNRSTWTFSAWIKKAPIDFNTSMSLLSAGSFGSDLFTIQVTDNGLSVPCIAVYGQIGGSAVLNIAETPARRDPSAWFHLVVVLDTTQATASNRLKLYYNGAQVTALTTATYPNQNTTFAINNNQATAIGSRAGGGAPYYDGYMTDMNFIDGQALTPASFGATDATTGVWNPIRYSGTYGTNGFYLNFSDPTSTTTIAYDYSGNSNNWTANNISVTAGTTYDSMVDVPIGYGSDTGVGGELRGNYATFNPIDVSPNSTAQTLTQANLSLFSSSGTRIDGAYSTMAVTSGKWYVELTCTTRTADYPTAGWCSTSFNTNGSGFQYQAGNPNNTKGASLDPGGAININGATTASNYYGTTWAASNIIQVAVDIDNKLIWFGKAGSWTGTAGNMNGNPATGTNGASFSGQGGTEFKFQCCIGDSDRGDVNFGQRAFSYTAPTGYKALCTQNLSTATIDNGANYIAASLYTGTGATQTVSNAVNSISFQPDLVWIKSRSAATEHKWTDSVRGTTKALVSNSAAAETTDSTGLTAFGSSGFTVGANTTYNNSGATYVGWQWKASGSTVSNTAGSITSTVSANTTAGFSVVTYTGTIANATVGHGLGVAPSMIIARNRANIVNWVVYHSSLTSASYYLTLDESNAQISNSIFWQGVAPTSTVFSLGANSSSNGSSSNIAYCFAAIAGYSAFGSYTGNGSTDGPFIYTGFRPRWVLVKRIDGDSYWQVLDTSRSPYNLAGQDLFVNLTFVEATIADGVNQMDIVSNGFKFRNANCNGSGLSYIYAAFAENPFNISRAR